MPSINNTPLFNFLPLHDLENHNLQQVNEYFRQIDDNLRALFTSVQCIPGSDGSVANQVDIMLPTSQPATSALRVLVADPLTGQVRDANSADLDDACSVVGISLNAVSGSGSLVNIRNQGFITDSNFMFDVNADPTLFLNGLGVISQTPPSLPTSTFNIQIGKVISADTMLVEIAQPITLI